MLLRLEPEGPFQDPFGIVSTQGVEPANEIVVGTATGFPFVFLHAHSMPGGALDGVERSVPAIDSSPPSRNFAELWVGLPLLFNTVLVHDSQIKGGTPGADEES